MLVVELQLLAIWDFRAATCTYVVWDGGTLLSFVCGTRGGGSYLKQSFYFVFLYIPSLHLSDILGNLFLFTYHSGSWWVALLLTATRNIRCWPFSCELVATPIRVLEAASTSPPAWVRSEKSEHCLLWYASYCS